MNEKEPELGAVAVGDELMVSASEGRRSLDVRVRVTRVGRVWIDVERLDGEYLTHYYRRFRMDTQKSESGRGRIYNDAQWTWRQRKSRAYAYLREIGVSADFGSRFRNDPLGLANVIRRGLGEDEL